VLWPFKLECGVAVSRIREREVMPASSSALTALNVRKPKLLDHSERSQVLRVDASMDAFEFQSAERQRDQGKAGLRRESAAPVLAAEIERNHSVTFDHRTVVGAARIQSATADIHAAGPKLCRPEAECLLREPSLPKAPLELGPRMDGLRPPVLRIGLDCAEGR